MLLEEQILKYAKQANAYITGEQVEKFVFYLIGRLSEKEELADKVGFKKLLEFMRITFKAGQEALQKIDEIRDKIDDLKVASPIKSLSGCNQLLSKNHAPNPNNEIKYRDEIIDEVKKILFIKRLRIQDCGT